MAGRAQLVSQFLENVSRSVLEEHQDIVRDYIRGREGVYALYRRGRLYYVGLASSLNRRLKQHLRDGHAGRWDRFSVYLTIGVGHMKEMESLLLRIVEPPGNKVRGKFHRAENLKRKVRADLKQRLHDQLDESLGPRRERRRRRMLHVGPASIPDQSATVLGEYVRRPFAIRAVYKGTTHRARVRSDGRIRFNGSLFDTPSGAGRVAIGRDRVNGWRLWQFEQAPGDWVPLATIRRRAKKRSRRTQARSNGRADQAWRL